MASFIYDSCLINTFEGRINFNSDAFKVVFLTSMYRPDKENDSSRADLTNEVVGPGYPDGGVSVDVKAALVNGALSLSLGSLKLLNATVSARYAIYVADRGGAPEEEELVACIDFGSDVSSTNSEFALTASSLKIQN